MKDLLVVRFAQIRNVVLAETLHMPEDLRGKESLASSSGYEVASCGAPGILGGSTLYLPGRDRDQDGNLAACGFQSEARAAAAIDAWTQLIKEVNAKRHIWEAVLALARR